MIPIRWNKLRARTSFTRNHLSPMSWLKGITERNGIRGISNCTNRLKQSVTNCQYSCQSQISQFTQPAKLLLIIATCSFSSFLVQMLSGSNGPLALCLKTGSRRTAKTGLGLGLDYVSLWESQVRKLSESSLRSTMHVGDPHFFATHQCVFLETSIFSIRIDHNTFETLNWSSGRPSWIQDTRQIQRKNGQEMWCGSTGQRKAVHSMSMKMCPFWNANINYHFHVWAKLEPTSGISISHAAWSKDQKTEMLYPKNMRRYSAVHVWHNIT